MQKIGIFYILLLFSLMAKSQDSTDFTLNNIKRYATNIEASLETISSNLKADRYGPIKQQAKYIKAYMDSVDEEMEYLPDAYYYRLSSIVNSFHTNLNEFERLTLKQDFLGKGRLLRTTITQLQQGQSNLKTALDVAYETAMQQQSLSENKRGSAMVEENTVPIVDQQQSATEDTTVINERSVVFVEATDLNKITTSNNPYLLRSINQAQQQIEHWINNIHFQMKRNDFTGIGVHAKSISNASLKISDLTLLLKSDQKASLFILATGLKNLSETLNQLAQKGIAAHDEMHECIDKIEIKFSTLSTGINLVQ